MTTEVPDDGGAESEIEWLLLEQLVDLLAWLLAVTNDWISPKDRVTWPLIDLWRYEETRALAQSGPLFFDLARDQLAVDFADDPESFAQYDQHTDFVSRFLLADRPTNGQGQSAGRAEIRALVRLMFRIHQPFNFWGLRVRRILLEDGLPDCLHTENAFCVALSDRLNTHPRLADLPGAVLSPEALRRLIPRP